MNEILADLYKCKNQGVVVGPGDDAGVFRYKNTLLVETVDVITPIVDDPYTFGAICAANSVSDVYAMGGTPLSALAILGFQSCDFGAPVIKKLLKGAIDKLREAGACLIGGHSIEDKEFKFGFAVTGVVDKKSILKARGAAAGDILILTKPLGTGILTSAFKLGKMKGTALHKVIVSMLMLNKSASQAAVLAGARAATDVTGFGLLGHASNMVTSSKVDLIILHNKVPLMRNVKDFIAQGIVPKGARNNLDFYSKNITFSKDISPEEKLALSDPQTSGGLLIALPSRRLRKFERIAHKEKMPYWIIGEVRRGKGKLLIT
ncbi:MAG: selenide, water dikinase SelD [Thermodesulfovibrionia bacterium]|nr:selenide, water dikinase SelD [Thermodesulfovibrionia bacterium]